MNDTSTMILIGVGTAGTAIARGVGRAFGGSLRSLLVDTDAASGQPGEPFLLLGGERLAGRGSGGDLVAARVAAEESIASLDGHLEGIRLAVVVTALGGGTGGGASFEILRHLEALGIPSIIFATTPFACEGEDRLRNARGILSMISDAAGASFFLPLDMLLAGEDNLAEGLKRAIGTVASGVTLFWRLVGKPGYIRLDPERIRRLVNGSGRGRFSAVTVQGPNRAAEAVEKLVKTELLTAGTAEVKSILCGVLAGDDLRLSELTTISNGLRNAFGSNAGFELATVNDEDTFSGRLSIVTMLFERNPGELVRETAKSRPAGSSRRQRGKNAGQPLQNGPQGKGRFSNSTPTLWHGEDIDIPTYLRENLSLDR